MNHLITPHGGELVNLMVDEERRNVLKDLSLHIPSLILSERQLCDLELIMNGAFSPLGGFMTSPDYESVVDRMRLQDGALWPIPICLDVTEVEANRLESGQSVALRDPEGFMLAVMHIEEIWPMDKQREGEAIYRTTDEAHPGVDYLFHHMGSHYVGGRIERSHTPLHFDFKQIRLTPLEVRRTIASRAMHGMWHAGRRAARAVPQGARACRWSVTCWEPRRAAPLRGCAAAS